MLLAGVLPFSLITTSFRFSPSVLSFCFFLKVSCPSSLVGFLARPYWVTAGVGYPEITVCRDKTREQGYVFLHLLLYLLFFFSFFPIHINIWTLVIVLRIHADSWTQACLWRSRSSMHWWKNSLKYFLITSFILEQMKVRKPYPTYSSLSLFLLSSSKSYSFSCIQLLEHLSDPLLDAETEFGHFRRCF